MAAFSPWRRAVARRDNWGGGGIFIYLCSHTIETIAFKRNPSGRIQIIYEYASPNYRSSYGPALTSNLINNMALDRVKHSNPLSWHALPLMIKIIWRHDILYNCNIFPYTIHCQMSPCIVYTGIHSELRASLYGPIYMHIK